jgi:hypothetical protein
MQAKVTIPFATVTQRFKVGDLVTVEQVGEAYFNACTDAKPEPAEVEPEAAQPAPPKPGKN